jgi:hypothetical protein
MLSDQNVRMINVRIGNELRTLDSICSSQEEKLEAIERIAKLKELLTPQPSRSDILRELAIALKQEQKPSTEHTVTDYIADAIATFRR